MSEIKCEKPDCIEPSEYDFNDYNMITDALTSFKFLETLIGTFKTECSNDVLLKKVEAIGKKIESETRDIFNLMYKKGWYKLEVATQDKINTTKTKFVELATELR